MRLLYFLLFVSIYAFGFMVTNENLGNYLERTWWSWLFLLITLSELSNFFNARSLYIPYVVYPKNAKEYRLAMLMTLFLMSSCAVVLIFDIDVWAYIEKAVIYLQ